VISAELLHSSLVGAIWIIGGGIALSGVDDLALDMAAHFRTLLRRLTIYSRHGRAACSELDCPPERPIAVLLPAWRESAVIGSMLRHMRASLAYRRYRVFMGHYPNDRATETAASAVDPRRTWLELVKLSTPGPTSKAHCLNGIWDGVLAYERRTGIRFEMFVLHDAEDVVHPAELKLFNYLAERADMIQIPVVPLPRRRRDLVAGTYLDEFAESHQKDLVLRERLAGGVPSAGVGCGFSREALESVAAGRNGHPFRTTSLTEDYDLALSLLKQGRRSIFVRLADHPPGRGFSARTVIATREYFPDRLADAVRQKARWLIGITLQSWRDQGWPGSLGAKYMLLRDRKALIAAPLSTLTYPLATALLAYEALRHGLMPSAEPLLALDGSLLLLLAFNGFLLTWRAAHRALYVWRLYGGAEAVFAVLRMPVANLVNCLAAIRAIRLYGLYRFAGRPLAWDKTRHAFPETDTAE